jgi:NADH-quinone oxidoreductase subunit L
MYLISLFLPFFSFFFGNFLGFKGVSFIVFFCLLFSVFASFFVFYEVLLTGSETRFFFFSWINLGHLKIDLGFVFDAIASIMLIMVLLISFIVHVYSLSYMQGDPNRNRFMSLLSLFTFFMLMLIVSSNFLQLLFGWEGVGICSYLLVNFWADRIAANRAALKALFFNRVGDLGMVLALIIILDNFKTLDFHLVFDLTSLVITETYILGPFSVNKIDLICFLFIIAAIAKSAQFFLHGWLADAMEGPTPVSALIHAATMVTAGIFLIARISPMLQYCPKVLNLIIIFGVITTIIFSFSGQNTNDLKKIVASSTASQLAYMFFVAGLLDNESSVFHLFLHAFFKALLFLSAGAIIHGLGDQQDIRKMGGLFKLMPFNTFCFLVGSLSLVGMPAATGSYYSKDPIIENTLLIDDYFDDFLNIGCELGVVNTFYYNIKLVRLVFFGHFRGPRVLHVHDSSFLITLCLFTLTLLSFVGPVFWELLVSEDSVFAQTFATINNFYREGNMNFFREEEVSFFLFWLIVLIVLFGLFHSEELFVDTQDSLNSLRTYSYFQELIVSDNLRWGFEYLMVKKFINLFYSFSNYFFFSIDRGLLEYLGPLFVIKQSQKFFFLLSGFQTGFLYHYILVFIISVLWISLFFFGYIIFELQSFFVFFFLSILIS